MILKLALLALPFMTSVVVAQVPTLESAQAQALEEARKAQALVEVSTVFFDSDLPFDLRLKILKRLSGLRCRGDARLTSVREKETTARAERDDRRSTFFYRSTFNAKLPMIDTQAKGVQIIVDSEHRSGDNPAATRYNVRIEDNGDCFDPEGLDDHEVKMRLYNMGK